MKLKEAVRRIVAEAFRDHDRGPVTRLTGESLRNEIMNVIHDIGDELGWDYVPREADVLDTLADRTRKEYAGGSATYDSAEARAILVPILAKMNARLSRRTPY